MKSETNHLPYLVEDMIFMDRNKAYGAYFIRKTYKDRVKRSIAVAIIVFGGVIGTPLVVDALEGSTPIIETHGREITEYILQSPPPPVDPTTPPPPPEFEAPQLSKSIAFTPPEVVPNDQAYDLPPTDEVLKDNNPGAVTNNGNGTNPNGNLDGKDDVPPADDRKVLIEEEDKIEIYVEQMPEFPGGDVALFKYLKENIKYPDLARESDIQGTVYVSFVINKKGEIVKTKITRGIGGGCDEEAMRVLKSMPAWTPGKQNGNAVSVAYSVPVKFRLARQ